MDDLIVKTILGFAFLMLVLAVALFVPAGSLSFWQAWAYLAVFAGCTILITAYLIKNDRELLAGRVKAGPVAAKIATDRLVSDAASAPPVRRFDHVQSQSSNVCALEGILRGPVYKIMCYAV